MNNENVIRVGIVGAGIVGWNHAEKISELNGMEVAAVADPQESLRARLCEQYKVSKAYASWENMVDDPSVDTVLIGTPHDLHCPIAVAAMESGKDVICEKPLAHNVEAGRKMVDASRRTGKKLLVALNHRFIRANQQMKVLLDEGAIGHPFLAVIVHLGNEFDRMSDPASWKGTMERSGGGVIIDAGAHIIDLLQWWLGPVESVTACKDRILVTTTNKEEDTAGLCLRFASNAVANVSLTFSARYSAWPDNYGGISIRSEVFGSDGAIRMDLHNRDVVIADSDGVKTYDRDPGMPSDMTKHLRDCLRRGDAPLVTADEALSDMEVIHAAYESSREEGMTRKWLTTRA